MNRAKEIAIKVAEEYKDTPYFDMAEPDMDWQWEKFIEPKLKEANKITSFNKVLEIACGHGRNSSKLLEMTLPQNDQVMQVDELWLVDIHDSNLEYCRNRFKNESRTRYVKNNGLDLKDAPDGYFNLIYSWDSMVHFHPLVMESYMSEIYRTLATNGIAFIHHSNLSAIQKSASDDNVGNSGKRSSFSSVEMVNLSFKNKLTVMSQELIDWGGTPFLDCITVLWK